MLFAPDFRFSRKLKQHQPENRINNRTGFFMSIFHFKGRGVSKKLAYILAFRPLLFHFLQFFCSHSPIFFSFLPCPPELLLTAFFRANSCSSYCDLEEDKAKEVAEFRRMIDEKIPVTDWDCIKLMASDTTSCTALTLCTYKAVRFLLHRPLHYFDNSHGFNRGSCQTICHFFPDKFRIYRHPLLL